MSISLRILVIAGSLLCLGSLSARAQTSWDEDMPAGLIGVGVDEHLDEVIPLDTSFYDEQGRKVSFGRLLEKGKPIILTLNYSNCPGLCIAQLNGLTTGLNDVGSLKLGTDFFMVSLSIDPTDSVKKAASTKARYADDLEDHHAIEGWSFWTGTEKHIQTIARGVGFNYTFDAKNNQFNHPAAAIFLSPKGRITRYLYEVGFVGPTLKMALVEAGEGKIGSSIDAFVLWCSHYNPHENRYSASAKILLSVFAGIFVTMGLVALLPFWLSGRKAKALQRNATDQTKTDVPETIGHAAPA
jgi:protein SCO1